MKHIVSNGCNALLSILIATLLALAPLAGCAQKKPAVAVGQKLPSLSLSNTSGERFTLPPDIEGKLTVILFWSKGCQYCKQEMPLMQPLFAKHKESGFLIVGVHEGDDPAAVSEMVQANGLEFPMLVDSKAEARKLYGIVAVPTMFVIAPDGSVREKILGGLSAEQIEKLVLGKDK